MNRRSKPIWFSVVVSIALLVLFFSIQWWKRDLLTLPVQYLLFALVPLVVGLLMSGYIREVKAGSVGLTIADEALASSKSIPDSGQAVEHPQKLSAESWQNDRIKEYQRTGGYMLAHVYKPSSERGQLFDISIFIVRHEKGTPTPPRRHFDEIDKVEFFFGESWGNRVFKVRGENGFFGVRTHAWGTFLAICRVSFKESNQAPIALYRYIDFSMAAAIDGQI